MVVSTKDIFPLLEGDEGGGFFFVSDERFGFPPLEGDEGGVNFCLPLEHEHGGVSPSGGGRRGRKYCIKQKNLN